MRKDATQKIMSAIVTVRTLVNIYQRRKRLVSKNYMTQLAPHQMLRDGFHVVIYMANGVTTARRNDCKHSQSDLKRLVAFNSMKSS